jgi:hypothetical protein
LNPKRAIRITAVAAAAAMLFGIPAEAASPASGSITRTKKSVSWNGGPFVLSEPGPNSDCAGGASDPICDHYILKINLGEGAKIEVAIKSPQASTGSLPAPDGSDFDLYIYSPDGTPVASSATAAGNEKATFKHKARWRNKAYEIRVVPWVVIPNSTYKGTAKALTTPK